MSDSNASRTAAPRPWTQAPWSYLGATVVVLLALLAAAGVKSYRDLDAARAHEATLHLRIEQTEERLLRLGERIGRIEGDPLTLERLAREELGMVYPEDVVIVLPEEPAPDRPKVSAARLAPREPPPSAELPGSAPP